MDNVESLPISCKQTPIMSPIPMKYSIDKNTEVSRNLRNDSQNQNQIKSKIDKGLQSLLVSDSIDKSQINSNDNNFGK